MILLLTCWKKELYHETISLFYLTSLREQAVLYAERFLLRGRPAVMNVYDIKDEFGCMKVKVFEAYDEEWLILTHGKLLIILQIVIINT